MQQIAIITRKLAIANRSLVTWVQKQQQYRNDLQRSLKVIKNGIISEIKRDIGRKSWFFSYPICIQLPCRRWLRQNFERCLVLGKREWSGYQMLKQVCWYAKPFWYSTRTWQTDRQTDRQNCCINIARQHYSSGSIHLHDNEHNAKRPTLCNHMASIHNDTSTFRA